MSASDKVIQKQQILIEQHKKKIEDLMSTIQIMKEETNKKMDQLVEMLTALTEATTHKVKDKQVTTGGSNGIPTRRLP
jgi:polyhydroxyalkanoate synthesis regulator phasin